MYKIPLAKNTFYRDIETREKVAKFILQSDKLSMGDKVKEFETKFSEWQGKKYSVMFNSGASANLGLLQSLMNMGLLLKGDRVAFSSLTWSTNVFPIIQMGLVPVPIDIDTITFNCDIKYMMNVKNLKAFFITNALGLTGNMREIVDYCKKNDIMLLEDNCESIGTKTSGIKTGNFGEASTFSFFVGHQFSTIEGGMVVTDRKDIYDMLLLVRANGWIRNYEKENRDYIIKRSGLDDIYEKYCFLDLGYNLRPTEIQGFIGSLNIEYLDEIIRKRFLNYTIIRTELNNLNIPIQKKCDVISSFCIPVLCENKDHRSGITSKLEMLGIETRPIIGGNMTRQPFWLNYFDNYYLPNCDIVHDCGFYIGNYPEMTESDIEYIIKALK